MRRSNTIRNKVYKFVHKQDEWIITNITGRNFSHERLMVEESGKITVKCSYGNGYAWDGCISRKEADIIFRLLLKKAGFMWWPQYYAAVRIFGGFYGKWNRWTSKFGIRVSLCSWDYNPEDYYFIFQFFFSFSIIRN